MYTCWYQKSIVNIHIVLHCFLNRPIQSIDLLILTANILDTKYVHEHVSRQTPCRVTSLTVTQFVRGDHCVGDWYLGRMLLICARIRKIVYTCYCNMSLERLLVKFSR